MKNIIKYRLTNLKGILMDSEFSWTFSEGEFSWKLFVDLIRTHLIDFFRLFKCGYTWIPVISPF